jgi:hypothetical protein
MSGNVALHTDVGDDPAHGFQGVCRGRSSETIRAGEQTKGVG